MDFFRKLFGGGTSTADKSGLYFYIQPKGCAEVVRVRIDRNNDLSQPDDGSGYFVRKTVRGVDYKCNRSAELELIFDDQRRLQSTNVMGGTLVTEADYQAWLAAQAPNT